MNRPSPLLLRVIRGIDTFTEWKAIYVDFSGRLQRAQIDNQ